jgi:hypothetical protein
LGSGDSTPVALALDQASRHERSATGAPNPGEELADALLGNRRILVLAENVLKGLRAGDETLLAAKRLGGIPGAFRPDADPVEPFVGGVPAQPSRRLAQLPVLGCGSGLEPLALPQRRGQLELRKQGPVTLRVQTRDQRVPRLFTLGIEQLEDRAERRRLLDGRKLSEEVLDQDVAVPNLSEQAAEPAQLVLEAPSPARVVQLRARRAEERAEAPRRNPLLVDLLGICAEPGALLVVDDLLRVREQRPLEGIVLPPFETG